MSVHPNTLLIAVLTPDDLPSKTYRAICADVDPSYDPDDLDEVEEVEIGECTYSVSLWDKDYDEDLEVSAPRGSIVLYGFATYGFGEKIEWAKLVALKDALDARVQELCAAHRCTAQIYVSANYW